MNDQQKGKQFSNIESQVDLNIKQEEEESQNNIDYLEGTSQLRRSTRQAARVKAGGSPYKKIKDSEFFSDSQDQDVEEYKITKRQPSLTRRASSNRSFGGSRKTDLYYNFPGPKDKAKKNAASNLPANIYIKKKPQAKGQVRRPWSQNEDNAIKQLVDQFGTKRWSLIAQKIREVYHIEGRSGKQCRERWHNHLDPTLRKDSLSLEQEKTLFQAHRQHGNKWAIISKMLPGRSDNSIKNHFYSTLRRHLRKINKGLKNDKMAALYGLKSEELTADYLYRLMRENKVAYEDISDINTAQIMKSSGFNNKSAKARNKKNKMSAGNKRNQTKSLKNQVKQEQQDQQKVKQEDVEESEDLEQIDQEQEKEEDEYSAQQNEDQDGDDDNVDNDEYQQANQKKFKRVVINYTQQIFSHQSKSAKQHGSNLKRRNKPGGLQMIVDLIQKDQSKIKHQESARQLRKKIKMKKTEYSGQQQQEGEDDDDDQNQISEQNFEEEEEQEEEEGEEDDEQEQDQEYSSEQQKPKHTKKHVKFESNKKRKHTTLPQNPRKKKKITGKKKVSNVKRQQNPRYEHDMHFPSSMQQQQPQPYHPDHFQQYPYYNPYFNPHIIPSTSHHDPHHHRIMYQPGTFPYPPFSPYPSSFFQQQSFSSSYRDSGFLSNRHNQQQHHSNLVSPGGLQFRQRLQQGGAFSGVQNYDTGKNSMGFIYTPRNAVQQQQSDKKAMFSNNNNNNTGNQNSINQEKQDKIQSSSSFKQKEPFSSINMAMPPAQNQTYNMSRNYSFAATPQNEFQKPQNNSKGSNDNKQSSSDVKKETDNNCSDSQNAKLEKISGKVLQILENKQNQKSEEQIKTPQLPSQPAPQNKPNSFVPPPLNIDLIQETQNQMHKQFEAQQQHSLQLQSSSNYPGGCLGGNSSTKSTTDLYQQYYNGNQYPVQHIQIPPSTIIRHAPSPINPLVGSQGYYYRNAGSGGTPTPYGYSGYSPHRHYSLYSFGMPQISPALRISPNSNFQPTFFGDPHHHHHHHHHPMESYLGSSRSVNRGRAGSIEENNNNKSGSQRHQYQKHNN